MQFTTIKLLFGALAFSALTTAIPQRFDENESDLPPNENPNPAPQINQLTCYQCQTQVNPKTGEASNENCLNPSSNPDQVGTCTVPNNDNSPFCGEMARYNSAGQLVALHRGCSTIWKKDLINDNGYKLDTNKCVDQNVNIPNAAGNGTQTLTFQNCLSTCTTNQCNDSVNPGQSSGLSTGAIVGIVIGSVVGFLLLVGIGYYIYANSGKQGNSYDPTATEEPSAAPRTETAIINN